MTKGTKVLCTITKLKFTELEAKVNIVRISYIWQYFISFVFVMQA